MTEKEIDIRTEISMLSYSSREEGWDEHIQRYGRPMIKLDTTKAVAPYMPFARSLTNVLRSSRNAGTYATAMNDIKAPPKNCTTSQPLALQISHDTSDMMPGNCELQTIAFVMGMIDSWSGLSRSHTVPIMIARPEVSVSYPCCKTKAERRLTQVHGDSDAISNHITITLDE